jgi:putative transposase
MLQPSKIYHIYNRANGTENLFRKPRNYRFFLDKCIKHIDPVVQTFAWCLMPNHFHLMIRVREEDVINMLSACQRLQSSEGCDKSDVYGKFLSKQFANLCSSYTQAYNKLYKRTGSLFQPNFKRKEVSNPRYFAQLVLYIHNNPVKHGYVNNPVDWPYSSLHVFDDRRKPDEYRMLSNDNKEKVLNWFGGTSGFNSAHRQIPPLKSVFE